MNGNLDSFFYTDPSQQSWLQTHENVFILVAAVLFVITVTSWIIFGDIASHREPEERRFMAATASVALVSSIALATVVVTGRIEDPTPAKVVSSHYDVGAIDTPCLGEDGECVSYVDKDGSKTILWVNVGDRDKDKDGWQVTVEKLGSASKEPATK